MPASTNANGSLPSDGIKTCLWDVRNRLVEIMHGVASVAQKNVVGGRGVVQWYFRPEGATTRHYLTDALNSTRALADDAKAIQTRYQYELFGETTSTGGGVDQ